MKTLESFQNPKINFAFKVFITVMPYGVDPLIPPTQPHRTE